jgi:hypothetical protein
MCSLGQAWVCIFLSLCSQGWFETDVNPQTHTKPSEDMGGTLEGIEFVTILAIWLSYFYFLLLLFSNERAGASTPHRVVSGMGQCTRMLLKLRSEHPL